MDLTGKTVVYVGGYGGIGFACCKQILAKDIARLVIVDVRQDSAKQHQLERLNAKARVHFYQLDLSNGREVIEATLKAIVREVGGFQVLFNGSGILKDRNPKLTVDVNLLGPIETTLAAVPLMSKAQGGRGGLIVNIASVLGLEPASFLAVYTATKHGVVGFTRACADPHYYAITGIAHIAVCPGPTATNILDNMVNADTFEYSKPITDKQMSAEKQTAEECAKCVMECISQAENGSVWICDLGKLQQVSMHKYWEWTF